MFKSDMLKHLTVLLTLQFSWREIHYYAVQSLVKTNLERIWKLPQTDMSLSECHRFTVKLAYIKC